MAGARAGGRAARQGRVGGAGQDKVGGTVGQGPNEE